MIKNDDPKKETAPESTDQAAMLAIMSEQLRQATTRLAELEKAAKPKRRGESVEEKARLQHTIRLRTWGIDKNGVPHCLTMGEAAGMNIEFGKGTYALLDRRQCMKIYGLEIAEDDGSLLHDGKKVPGTSDAEFLRVQAGGETIAQRVEKLTRRASVLQSRYGVNIPMPDSNDLDSWETRIAEAEQKARSGSAGQGVETDFGGEPVR